MNLLDNNRSSNNSMFTWERYTETISNVKEAKYHKDIYMGKIHRNYK